MAERFLQGMQGKVNSHNVFTNWLPELIAVFSGACNQGLLEQERYIQFFLLACKLQARLTRKGESQFRVVKPSCDIQGYSQKLEAHSVNYFLAWNALSGFVIVAVPESRRRLRLYSQAAT